VQLADPSPAGSTLLVVKGPTTGSYCGSLGSITSTTGRPLNLQLSVGGDLTGTVRGDSATFIDVTRTLSGTLHIDHGAVIGTSSFPLWSFDVFYGAVA
ncbi:MAG: hypothetical protein Q8L55_09240, partial [Phycisphaerales bacterium]|nr:hypothetical protein [Phycisphaerales bacterium]